jgi:hypothetical protein
MKRWLTTVTMLACLVILAPAPLIGADDSAETQTPPISELFNPSALHDQLTAALVKVLDAYLDYLARPETSSRLATFQRNYYNALVEKGFTEKQAFRLVRDLGNPLSGFSMNGQ